MLGSVQSTAARGEDRVNDAIRTARIIASVEAVGLWKDPDQSIRVLEAILERDPVIQSVWLVFEPDVVDGAAATARFSPRVTRDRSRGEHSTVDRNADVATGAAYERTVRDFRERGEIAAHVGDPVLRGGELVIEITYPIVADGRLIGVAGAEYATREIEVAVHAIAADLGMQLFVVSAGGVFIATSIDPLTEGLDRTNLDESKELRATRVDRSAFASVLVPMLARDGAPRLAVENDPVTGRATYFATAGTQSGNWRIILATPVGEIDGPIVRTVVRNVIIGIVGLSIVVGILLWLALSVRGRINRAIVVAEAIAVGNLTMRDDEETTSRDESSVLLRALGEMAKRLGGLMASVKAAGRTLEAGVVDLGKSAAEQREAAMPLGQSATQVAAAVKQISATGIELTRTMQSIQENAADTADLAQRGRQQLAAVDGSMRELDGATSSVAAKLAAINERAVAINTVVTTITKVADQTNLLSVNAAIEAEKAGEQGRGFLVVAREIRRLADQTAAATLDIGHMVEEMQSAVSAGVMEMDRFADKARRGVEDVNETARRMGEIIGQVAENTSRFREVTEGMASQSAGAMQISDATGLLQQSARSAIEGFARLSTTARSLEAASDALRSEVAAFRVADDA